MPDRLALSVDADPHFAVRILQFYIEPLVETNVWRGSRKPFSTVQFQRRAIGSKGKSIDMVPDVDLGAANGESVAFKLDPHLQNESCRKLIETYHRGQT